MNTFIDTCKINEILFNCQIDSWTLWQQMTWWNCLKISYGFPFKSVGWFLLYFCLTNFVKNIQLHKGSCSYVSTNNFKVLIHSIFQKICCGLQNRLMSYKLFYVEKNFQDVVVFRKRGEVKASTSKVRGMWIAWL